MVDTVDLKSTSPKRSAGSSPALGIFLEKAGLSSLDHSILHQAFLHTSYTYEQKLPRSLSNERLEFIGDSVYELLLREYLYNKYPDEDEGTLGRIRSYLSGKKAMAIIARKLNFSSFIRLGKGMEIKGGRDNDNILSSTLEAFLGAIYLTSDWEETKRFFYGFIVSIINALNIENDPKNILNQCCQHKKIIYTVISKIGKDHAPTFHVLLSVDGKKTYGKGNSIKEAEKDAARKFLIKYLKMEV